MVFFTAKPVSSGDGTQALRYFLTDQRVSDLLEAYPNEDITLIMFSWLNYYIKETPLRNRITLPVADEKTSTPLTSTSDKDSEGKESTPFYAEDTYITQYNQINESNNNTLYYTSECNSKYQSFLYSGVSAGTSAGELTALKYSPKLFSIRYNVPTLMLAVNKNSYGENLVALRGSIDENTLGNTTDLVNTFDYVIHHLSTAIVESIVGFCQTVHNGIAVGSMDKVYDISWFFKLITGEQFRTYYFGIAIALVVFVALTKLITFLVDKTKSPLDAVKAFAGIIALSLVPAILLSCVSDCIYSISKAMTKDVSKELALIEIEDYIKSSEDLNISFETQYVLFRKQFDEISDAYKDLEIPIAVGYDEATALTKYDKSTLKALYDSVCYNEILATKNVKAKQAESATDFATVKYDNVAEGVEPFYYSYQTFVPVNYNKYGDSVFYYFYDYIKYQYLSYWASQNSSDTYSFTKLAKNFELPDGSKDVKWSTYINDMWTAEESFLTKSYGGINSMYNNPDYVYASQYDSKGKKITSRTYEKDLFGLSYLFKMTDSSCTGYYPLPSDDYFNNTSLTDWASSSRRTFQENNGSWNNLLTSIKDKGVSSVSSKFYPLPYIMNGYSWNDYRKSKYLTIDTHEDTYENYFFSPTYLNEYYAKSYATNLTEQFNKSVNSKRQIYNSTLSLVAGERQPWRLYGSLGLLYQQTYKDGTFETNKLPIEDKLAELNHKIYNDVTHLTTYMKGGLRDDTLIFTSALMATFEFNKMFSDTTEVYPQSLSIDTIDLDKLMRASFAQSIDDVSNNRNVMFMIQDSHGCFTALMVAISECVLYLTVIIRCAIVVLMYISVVVLCFSFFHITPQLKKEMLVGVVCQLGALIVGQVLLLGSVVWGIEVLGGTTKIAGIFLSLVYLLTNIIVCYLNSYMLFALIKDMRHFGGTILNSTIQSAMSIISTKVARIGNAHSNNMSVVMNVANFNNENTVMNANNYKQEIKDKRRNKIESDITTLKPTRVSDFKNIKPFSDTTIYNKRDTTSKKSPADKDVHSNNKAHQKAKTTATSTKDKSPINNQKNKNTESRNETNLFN